MMSDARSDQIPRFVGSEGKLRENQVTGADVAQVLT